MHHTLLCTISKHFVARLPLVGNDSLTLTKFERSRSKEKCLERYSLLLNKPNFNEWDILMKFKWPKRLCHNLPELLIVIQAKDKGRGAENCNEKNLPRLGHFASVFHDTRSCTAKPSQEKMTWQFFSTNRPTEVRLLDIPVDTQISLNEDLISPISLIAKWLTLAEWDVLDKMILLLTVVAHFLCTVGHNMTALLATETLDLSKYLFFPPTGGYTSNKIQIGILLECFLRNKMLLLTKLFSKTNIHRWWWISIH